MTNSSACEHGHVWVTRLSGESVTMLNQQRAGRRESVAPLISCLLASLKLILAALPFTSLLTQTWAFFQATDWLILKLITHRIIEQPERDFLAEIVKFCTGRRDVVVQSKLCKVTLFFYASLYYMVLKFNNCDPTVLFGSAYLKSIYILVILSLVLVYLPDIQLYLKLILNVLCKNH